ncbi:glycosyltransferase [Pedobacter antarcticus]|uniref:glycosyltransferase n=1 Tax=Pedobacter antarcticus TaxID=34086 RepID=UPI00088ABEAF|nr:glycosyltransferase [Pedobacter antarcticus]SDM17609.1 rhamnosyltransferase [Pedobacter antarcticus]
MKQTIDILLATYNGSAYLNSQLYSLLSQTLTDWRLIIHDDGSTDETVAIIRKFVLMDDRITFIEDNIQFGNAADNFTHLLKFSTSQLMICCDQDDIWFENKLQLLVAAFGPDANLPQGVFCNGFAYSTDTGIISDKITFVNPKDLNEQLFMNGGIQGCSLMVNRALLNKIIIKPSYVAMHDHLISMAVVCFGTMSYVDKNLMLYRQFHDNKVTANINYSLKSRIKSIFVSDVPVVDRKHYEANLAFFETYKTQLKLEQIALFEGYFEYVKSGFFRRIQLVINNKFTLYNSIFALMMKTLMRKPIN